MKVKMIFVTLSLRMKALFFAIFIFLALPVQANRPIRLFENGQMISNYDEVVRQLRAGDTVEMSDGLQLQVLNSPKGGSSTLVFQVRSISDGKKYALRLPLHSGFWAYDGQKIPMQNFINFTIAAIKELSKGPLRIPKLNSALAGQYALMEFVDIEFSLTKFLQNPQQIDAPTRVQALEALMEFAKAVAAYGELIDFRQDNIVYSKKKNEWIFLDPIAGNKRLSNSASQEELNKNPFHRDRVLYHSGWPLEVFALIDKTIESSRRLNFATNLCSKIHL